MEGKKVKYMFVYIRCSKLDLTFSTISNQQYSPEALYARVCCYTVCYYTLQLFSPKFSPKINLLSYFIYPWGAKCLNLILLFIQLSTTSLQFWYKWNFRQEHEFAVKIARSAFQLTVQYLENGKEKVQQDNLFKTLNHAIVILCPNVFWVVQMTGSWSCLLKALIKCLIFLWSSGSWDTKTHSRSPLTGETHWYAEE